jgi:dTDP-4-dehydrorhamnose 3,5-epimerase
MTAGSPWNWRDSEKVWPHRWFRGQRQTQVSFTLTYPGTIKAIHYHAEQTDLWAPVSGMLQVFLYDLRCKSKTFGVINTIYAGKFHPWEILIPPGVVHGYKALGVEPVQLLYFTDRHYNPANEFTDRLQRPRDCLRRSTNESMRILIIGFNGMLGKDLPQEWSEDEVIPATSRDADIHDCGQVRQLLLRRIQTGSC